MILNPTNGKENSELDEMLAAMNNDENAINENWLNDPYPKNHCPYCGEDYDINFEPIFYDDDVIYWATCGKCKRTWGQRFAVEYTFLENCEYDEENDAPLMA